MRKFICFLIFAFFIFPNVIIAKSNYEDIIYKIVDEKIEENKINVYLFYGRECPHCEEERKFIDSIKEKYSDKVNFIMYEVWHDEGNAVLLKTVKERMNIKQNSVPLTVIGKDYFIGYSDTIKNSIVNKIDSYTNNKKEKSLSLPLLGNVDIKKISIPLVAIILGFVDGFNPCAMWILLFLINMLFNVKSKKRRWLLGFAFLLVSGIVYFLSMMGMSFILDITKIAYIRFAIALVALIAGFLSIKKFIKTRKDTGCTIVDDKKRKNIFIKLKKITQEHNFLLSLIGIVFLAFSVNMIELACSLGFPMIFSEILALNDIAGFVKLGYLLLYIIFYLVDDIAVFVISMITLEAAGVSTKYNKIASLISGVIMILMGILLILKPEILMFNF